MCSKTCGVSGVTTRLRACIGDDGVGGCRGKSVETRDCYAGSCATWLEWGEWDSCRSDETRRETDCDGGTRERVRQCEWTEDLSSWGCGYAGSIQVKRCAEEPCKPEMPFWNDQMGQVYSGWTPIPHYHLPRADTMLERCVSYCNDHRRNEKETVHFPAEPCTAVRVITRGRVLELMRFKGS